MVQNTALAEKNFIAWIGDDDSSPKKQVGGIETAKWISPCGNTVSNEGLVDLSSGICCSESGAWLCQENEELRFWSNVQGDGSKVVDGAADCSSWESKELTNNGRYGNATKTKHWSNAGSATCVEKLHLVCIESR